MPSRARAQISTGVKDVQTCGSRRTHALSSSPQWRAGSVAPFTCTHTFKRHAYVGTAQISRLWLMPGLLSTKTTIYQGSGGPKSSRPRTVLEFVRCTQRRNLARATCVATLCVTNTAVQSVADLAPNAWKDSERVEKMCIFSLFAKAKQGGAVFLKSDAAKWL
eukprot:6201280-Pleurochrysis_carterae.AAC.1